jgi:hypothetical protein
VNDIGIKFSGQLGKMRIEPQVAAQCTVADARCMQMKPRVAARRSVSHKALLPWSGHQMYLANLRTRQKASRQVDGVPGYAGELT